MSRRSRDRYYASEIGWLLKGLGRCSFYKLCSSGVFNVKFCSE